MTDKYYYCFIFYKKQFEICNMVKFKVVENVTWQNKWYIFSLHDNLYLCSFSLNK